MPCSDPAHFSSLAPQWPTHLYLMLQHLLALSQSTTLSHASQPAQFQSLWLKPLLFFCTYLSPTYFLKFSSNTTSSRNMYLNLFSLTPVLPWYPRFTFIVASIKNTIIVVVGPFDFSSWLEHPPAQRQCLFHLCTLLCLAWFLTHSGCPIFKYIKWMNEELIKSSTCQSKPNGTMWSGMLKG